MYIGQSESARFWLIILNDIQRRGVKDILIALDSLKDFVQAIKAVFPQTKVQLCIVHQVGNSLKYAAKNDYRQMVVDSMRRICQAADRSQAQKALPDFDLM